MHMSNYLESGILNYIVRANSNSFTRPTNIAIALCRNVPTESQTGATIPELANSNGYSRVNLGTPSNTYWTEINQTADGSGYIQNVSTFSFGPATADWGMVSGIAVLDSGVYGLGSVLFYAPIPTPRDIRSGDTYQFTASNFSIYLD